MRNFTRASRVSAGLVAVIAALLALGAAAAAPAARAATQVGYTGPSFAGLDAEASGGAVTGQKPESKLWYHDGSWWAPLITPSGAHTIHRLVGTSWQNTGVLVDARVTSREDVLSLGSTLYVLVREGSGAKLARFSYAAGAYTLDSGFPASVPGAGAETLTLARDSTGTLWLTYEQGGQVFVAHTLGSDASWGGPFLVPGGTGLNADDISAVISFTDSAGPAIGVMWSNQNDNAQHFAVHRDGSGDSAWTHETALSGTNEADDHINLKTYDGYVFAVVKTSLDSVGSAAPLIKLLVRTPTGSWNAHRVATVGEGNTRPITLLQIDPAVRTAYVFMTIGEGPSSRGIAYKQTSIDSVNFPANRTVFIQGANNEVINDATSTKQNLNGASGVVVAASDGSKYWWNRIDPSGPPPPNTAPTASPGEASTTKDTPVAITLTGRDAESCELAFSITAPPAHGTLGPLANAPCTPGSGTPHADTATVTYTPAQGYTGPDSFSFQVSDGSLSSAPATVSVTVDVTGPPTGGITFRSASGGGNSTATSLVLSAPAGIAGGDLLLASIDVRGSPGITAPAGWSLVRADQSGNTIKQAVYYKVATASEPVSYTWSWGGAQGASGGISAYSGVDSSAPIAASAGQVNAHSTSITAPSVTTTGPSQLVVGAFGTATATTISPPGGFTERFDAFATAGTYRATSELADKLQSSASATGTRIATAATSAANIGQTVALKPGGAPPPPPANTAPVASTGQGTTTTDTPVAITLTGLDAESCELAFSIALAPGHGTLGALGAQSCTSGSPHTDTATVTYTPVAGYTGSDSFSFQVSDGSLTSAPATVTVTVNDAPPPPPGGGIIFRSASGGGNATATTLTLPAPAGIVPGDLLLASIDVRGSPAITAPVGWTLVRSDQSGYTIKQAVYYKVATASEPASYTWTWSGAQGASGGISAYSGVDSSAPIAASTGQVNASSTSITASSLTTTGPNQLVVGIFGGAAATAISPPAGYSERFDASSTAGTYRATSELSDRLQASPGSSGILTATAGATAVSIGQTVALKPA